MFAGRSEIDECNEEHEAYAARLRDMLIGLIEEKAQELSSEDMFLAKFNLQEAAQQFRVCSFLVL
jgi:signal transducer and activator of transcription 5B